MKILIMKSDCMVINQSNKIVSCRLQSISVGVPIISVAKVWYPETTCSCRLQSFFSEFQKFLLQKFYNLRLGGRLGLYTHPNKESG